MANCTLSKWPFISKSVVKIIKIILVDLPIISLSSRIGWLASSKTILLFWELVFYQFYLVQWVQMFPKV